MVLADLKDFDVVFRVGEVIFLGRDHVVNLSAGPSERRRLAVNDCRKRGESQGQNRRQR